MRINDMTYSYLLLDGSQRRLDVHFDNDCLALKLPLGIVWLTWDLNHKSNVALR